MTVEEAYQTYGAKVFTVSVGANIVFVVRQIYNSDDDLYLRILQVLNPRVNWTSIPAGTTLQYLDPTVVTQKLY